jgi:hemolysin III
MVLLLHKGIPTGDPWVITGFSIYGFSLVLLYFMSTFYHWVTKPSIKRILRYGDHISVYFLIAGTYSPLSLVTLRHSSGLVIFGLIWGIALIGTFLKILKFDGFFKIGLFFFLGMGWVAIFALSDVIAAMETRGFYWIGAGGAFYTLGTYFFAKDEAIPYFHAIWHLYVLGGSITHFMAIYFYC